MTFPEARDKIAKYYINSLDSSQLPACSLTRFYAGVAEIEGYSQLFDFFWNHLGSSNAVHKLIFNALSS